MRLRRRPAGQDIPVAKKANGIGNDDRSCGAWGLDYGEEVCVNGKVVGEFKGSFVPHVFDLTPHLKEKDNLLKISFLPPPRWLGQSGYTSRMREWKPR